MKSIATGPLRWARRDIRSKVWPQKGRMGPFWANPALGFFPFSLAALVLKRTQTSFLVQGLFLHCHWRDASIAEICLSNWIFHPQFFVASRPFLVSCFSALQSSYKIQTKNQAKIQTKFRQSSDKNSDTIQTNSDKIQTSLNQPNLYKTRQN